MKVVSSRRIRRKMGIFRNLLFISRGLGLPPQTMDKSVLCGGCIFTAHDPFAAGAAAALGMSWETINSVKGGGGGEAHKSEKYLLSFAGYELSCHMRHFDAERAKVI